MVGFFAGRKLAAQWIPALQILDAHKRDITPHGVTWTTVRIGQSWWLELRLNDRKLPVPYTIDPAVLRTGGAGAVATITGAGTGLNVVVPAAAVAQDFLFLHFAQAFNGVPACPAGWNVANLSGGGTSGVATATLGEITCWKKAIATDPGATVALTRASGVAAAALIMSYRGVDTSLVSTTPGATSPLRQAAVAAYNPGANGANTTFPALSANTAIANEEVVGFGASASASTWTSPAGAYVIEQSGNAAGITVGTGDKNVAVLNTAVPAQVVTLSVSAPRQGMTFGLTNDTGAPTNGAETMSVVSGNAYQAAAGGSIYYNGNNAGSLTLSDPFTDAQSGPFSVNYPVLSGVWTHANETPTTLPNFTSGTFSWSASAAAAPALSLTETDAAGNTAANTVTLVNDTAVPTGGTISVPANSATLNNLVITTANFVDAGSGMASNVITRSNAADPNDSRRILPRRRLQRRDRRHEPRHRSHGRHVLRLHVDRHRPRRQRRDRNVEPNSRRHRDHCVIRHDRDRGRSKLTCAHTTANKTMRMLVVGASAEFATNNSCQASNVTYNGVALNFIAQTATTAGTGGAYDCYSLWYMVAPPVGTFNIVVTYTGTPRRQVGWGVGLWNVKQAAPDAFNQSFLEAARRRRTSRRSLPTRPWSTSSRAASPSATWLRTPAKSRV